MGSEAEGVTGCSAIRLMAPPAASSGRRFSTALVESASAACYLRTARNYRSCMERSTTTVLRIGAWCVHPPSGQISRDGETARVEVRTMRLLLCLAEHAGEVVSIDELLNQVWPDIIVSPDSVYQAVASLRRLLSGTDRYTQQDPGASGTRSCILVPLQGQTSNHR